MTVVITVIWQMTHQALVLVERDSGACAQSAPAKLPGATRIRIRRAVVAPATRLGKNSDAISNCHSKFLVGRVHSGDSPLVEFVSLHHRRTPVVVEEEKQQESNETNKPPPSVGANACTAGVLEGKGPGRRVPLTPIV
ncbi:MAG: hypothetical protein CMJ81_23430 [Planctomycetaceae bacterium]|nr:hypothetical protein [Planctomycetaceae bacterium]